MENSCVLLPNRHADNLRKINEAEKTDRIRGLKDQKSLEISKYIFLFG